MKKFKILILAAALGLPFSCSEDFLEITPNGALDQSILATANGVNSLLIGCYAMLDGTTNNIAGWEAASSNWVFGSIRGLEANKGTDAGDQPDINPIQTYSEVSTNPYLNAKWRALYDAIARTNEVLKVLALAEERGTVTADEAASFRAQARTMRGLFHFDAWRMWEKIPYVDESTNLAEVGNSEDVRDKILADLATGLTLANNMGQIGRFNQTVARVLLAKAQMQMKKDFAGAKTNLQWVVQNGAKPNGAAIGLDPNYGNIFDAANRNGLEAVYTIQYSVNDGSGGWNAGQGEVLNFPYKGGGGSPGGCCGFFQPSHDFVNSFRTSNGLPLLDGSYNQQPVKTDQGLSPSQPFTPDAGPLDPRLDWSVGRRGIPYFDWGPHTGSDWIRDQSYAGPFSPKKQVYKKAQEGTLTEVGNWTSGWTANGYRLIRYADVLLLLAECEIETGNIAGARTLINQVRARAANPETFVKNPDGTDAANYQISLYPTSGAPFDSKTNALAALAMERKLELGMEGHRYFDLQRWGNVVPELNRALNFEKTILPSLYGSATVGPEDVTYPIPQNQLDLMKGRLVQNR